MQASVHRQRAARATPLVKYIHPISANGVLHVFVYETLCLSALSWTRQTLARVDQRVVRIAVINARYHRTTVVAPPAHGPDWASPYVFKPSYLLYR